MAAAFLPWERWLGRLLHAVSVAIRRFLYKARRRRSLARSSGWIEAEATVERIEWDSSLPREEIAYWFTTARGRYTGYQWIWFESPNELQPHVGYKILVRYDDKNPEKSVFLRTA
jgi:hypothetical protein